MIKIRRAKKEDFEGLEELYTELEKGADFFRTQVFFYEQSRTMFL